MKSEVKVGFFILIGLVLLGGLLLTFSKGRAWFTPVYHVKMTTSNVAGLKRGAAVTMLGVGIGNVSDIFIDPEGKSVTLVLEILQKFKIRKDSRFTFEQAGFLGDQYVAITPTGSAEPFLQEGDRVSAKEPFNIQEMARSAAGLLQKIDEASQGFNNLLERLDKHVLSEHTLTNLTIAVANFRSVSERALAAVEDVQLFVATNKPALTQAVTNFSRLGTRAGEFVDRVDKLVDDNSDALSGSLNNLKTATESARKTLEGIEAGKGLAGDLLKNEELKERLHVLIENLQVASSNVANYGLLFKPNKARQRKEWSTSTNLYPGKTPFR